MSGQEVKHKQSTCVSSAECANSNTLPGQQKYRKENPAASLNITALYLRVTRIG